MIDGKLDQRAQPPVVVAIDGPAGSGKTSVSREVANRLGYELLDTGAAYRALTWLALDRGVDLDDTEAVIALLDGFPYSTDGGTVRMGDLDVTGMLRTPRVSEHVSRIARLPAVREALNASFRSRIAETTAPGIVVEGRDITTVVAPDAPVRILLTADEAARISRRANELPPEQADSADQLRDRDRRDAQVVDFLSPAEGVELIDSTDLDFEETVRAVLGIVGTCIAGRE